MNGLGRRKEEEKNTQSIFTKETFGVVLVLFATLSAVCLITRDAVFSAPGAFVNGFLFGCFGIFAYAVVLAFAIFGVLLIVDKKITMSKKRKALFTLAFVLVALIVHVITMSGKDLTYGEYIVTSYTMASGGFATASGGGLIMSIVAYPITALLTDAGAYVVVGIALAATVYFIAKDYLADKPSAQQGESRFRSSYVKEDPVVAGVEIQGEKDYPVQGVVSQQAPAKQKLFVNNPQDFALKGRRELAKESNSQSSAIKLGFADGGLGVVSTPEVKPEQKPAPTAADDYKSKLDYIKTPPTLNVETLRNNSRPSYGNAAQNVNSTQPTRETNTFNQNGYTSVSGYINPRTVEEKPVEEKPAPSTEREIPFIEHSGVTVAGDSATSRAENFGRRYAEIEDIKPDASAIVEKDTDFRAVEKPSVEEIKPVENVRGDIPFIEETFGEINETVIEEKPQPVEPEPELPPSTVRNEGRMRSILFGDDKPVEPQEQTEQEPVEENPVREERSVRSLGFTSRVAPDGNLSNRRSLDIGDTEVEPQREEKPKKPELPINREYFRPPLDLLENYAPPVDMPKENHEERMEIIQRTLEEFHINAVPQSYVQGPSITRYEIMMPAGVSVKKVLGFDDDLKMRLAAKDGVRIQAPIPGKNLVGIEVANNVKTTVGLREILEGAAGQKAKEGALMFALGKDLVGKPIMDDLSKGPHYLVAGATGSGKSVCLNLMIVSLIMRYSPEDLRLILVDPKGVEFINYEHIPHLMIDEIITEPKKALAVLSWAYTEMERRFAVFRESGGGLVVDIDSYNSVVANDTVAKMPRIVIIIDELADLMETCKKDLESRIRAIAQKARAAGIHLVLATQRPSVDIITGTIKANLPSRIAFKVMNFNDSQTILSEAGAEKLLGNGDMLYKTARMSTTERYQGAYISSREVNNIVTYIKEHNAAYFDDELQDFLDKETRPKQEENTSEAGGDGDDANEVNEFFLKALWLAVNTETVSISQLQRRFQIGYSRAGGLVDKMERMGFVSPNEGSKARRVLLTREQFEERFGSMPD